MPRVVKIEKIGKPTYILRLKKQDASVWGWFDVKLQVLDFISPLFILFLFAFYRNKIPSISATGALNEALKEKGVTTSS